MRHAAARERPARHLGRRPDRRGRGADRPRRRLGAPPPRPRRPDLHRPARPQRAGAARRPPGDDRGGLRRGRARCAPSTWSASPARSSAARRATSTRTSRRARSSSPWPTCELLAESETPPFPVDEDTPVDETLRLRYRYLDLRRERMRDAIVLRHDVVATMRRVLDERDFLEVETPILTRSTPEGARDFLVPSRAAAGQVLRAAAVAAALQAAADGRRLRALLPDRALLPRRGPARRPPARVHPARPRDGLRRGGGRPRRHGGGHGRGLRGGRLRRAGAAVAADGLPRGHGALRLGPPRHALRPRAARRGRRPARLGVPGLRVGPRRRRRGASRSTPARARSRAPSSTGSTRSCSATAPRRSPGPSWRPTAPGARRSRSSSATDRIAAATRALEALRGRPAAVRRRPRADGGRGARRAAAGARRGASASIPDDRHDVFWVVDFPMFEPVRGRAASPPRTTRSPRRRATSPIRPRMLLARLRPRRRRHGARRRLDPHQHARGPAAGLRGHRPGPGGGAGALRVPARGAALRRAAARRHRHGARPHRRPAGRAATRSATSSPSPRPPRAATRSRARPAPVDARQLRELALRSLVEPSSDR